VVTPTAAAKSGGSGVCFRSAAGVLLRLRLLAVVGLLVLLSRLLLLRGLAAWQGQGECWARLPCLSHGARH
jgi:hypothetical protein